MFYLIIGLALLPITASLCLCIYLDHLEVKTDQAETALFNSFSPEQRMKALADARAVRRSAWKEMNELEKHKRHHKWGYRRNPYYTQYNLAKRQFASACRRVRKLEELTAKHRSH